MEVVVTDEPDYVREKNNDYLSITNKYIRNPYIYSMPEKPEQKVNLQDLIDEYLHSLDEMELIAYNIAKSHLGTLFSVEKSNHYLEWFKGRSPK
jgi:hypothetical protein